uniref:Uncharacterized protein n=1 Tax=Arundo donax TaxID=35708 RepID=A0A0A9C9A7_ARUDO
MLLEPLLSYSLWFENTCFGQGYSQTFETLTINNFEIFSLEIWRSYT